MSTVQELMTATPITIKADDEIGLARDAILESGVHCLPIVDDSGRPIGVVSSWDLVEEYAPQDSVRNAMTERVLTIGPDEEATTAAGGGCGTRLEGGKGSVGSSPAPGVAAAAAAGGAGVCGKRLRCC